MKSVLRRVQSYSLNSLPRFIGSVQRTAFMVVPSATERTAVKRKCVNQPLERCPSGTKAQEVRVNFGSGAVEAKSERCFTDFESTSFMSYVSEYTVSRVSALPRNAEREQCE